MSGQALTTGRPDMLTPVGWRLGKAPSHAHFRRLQNGSVQFTLRVTCNHALMKKAHPGDRDRPNKHKKGSVLTIYKKGVSPHYLH
jgi:hypothetical protein